MFHHDAAVGDDVHPPPVGRRDGEVVGGIELHPEGARPAPDGLGGDGREEFLPTENVDDIDGAAD